MWLTHKEKYVKWFLEYQYRSPKNTSFASFFYGHPVTENNQQTLSFRLVDSCLTLCSYLYLFGMKLHRGWYRYGLGKPRQLYVKEPNGKKRQVVTFAVGNYTWGGTGKTPFVLFLSKLLVSRGYQPLILSRGYGHRDEAKMMIQQGMASHVITGSNREEAFHKTFSFAVSSPSMVVILDDGLQHWRLSRQVNILMVNAALAFGINGHFIPRGSLRESPQETAARSTCIVLHHCNQISNIQLQQLKTWFQVHCPEKPILTSSMVARTLYLVMPNGKLSACALNTIANQDTVLCCGIEYPRGFLQTVVDFCHPRQVSMECHVDHYFFCLQDLVEIVRKWNSRYMSWNLLVTEKDYYRNEKAFHQLVENKDMTRQVQVYVVQAELQVHSGIQKLAKLLDELGLSPTERNSGDIFI